MTDLSKLTKFLFTALPDLADEPQSEVVKVVEGVGRWMYDNWRPEWGHIIGQGYAFGEAPNDPNVDDGDPDADYYIVEAQHTRLKGPAAHSFIGVVPMVKITLPKGDSEHVINANRLGVVLDGDHFLYNQTTFESYYEGYFNFPVGHVELLTPVRYFGYRFAAVAIYLVYDADGNYRTFVFEAGMATGKPRVLYASKDGSPILNRKAGYTPTPFSSIDHYYSGNPRFTPDGDLIGWRIQIHKEKWLVGSTEFKPFFRLDATATRVDSAAPVSVPGLIVQAACRVAAIAHARGEEVDGLGTLTPMFAAIGRDQYDWINKPGDEG